MPIAEPIEGRANVFQKPVFDQDTKSMYYTSAAENYTGDPEPKDIIHTSADETSVHF